jgi:hypothetical protein
MMIAAIAALALPMYAGESKFELRAAKAEAKLARKARAKMMKEARASTTSNLAVSGETLKTNLAKVENEMTWHDDAESALKTAVKEDKPVFLMHVLGQRCGDT